MSYADRIFKDNCREILTTAYGIPTKTCVPTGRTARPPTPSKKIRHCKSLQPAPGVPHPHHPPNVLQDLYRRAAVDLAAEVQQHP